MSRRSLEARAKRLAGAAEIVTFYLEDPGAAEGTSHCRGGR